MITIFQFEERDIPHVEIQCNGDMKTSQVLEKFKNKILVPLDLNDYLFYYNGQEINKDSTMTQLKASANSSIIIIKAKKRTKIMKCPECISNSCYIQIINYGLKFSQCPYNHCINKNFGDYEKSQKIDFEKIKCDSCRKSQKTSLKEFYKCLNCSEEFKSSSYFCADCIKTHAQGEKKSHKLIKYDEKYYLCSKHYNKFISYCSKCKSDLCDICEKNHKGKDHEIIKYDSKTPDVELIIKDLEDIKATTAKARNHISKLNKMIEDAFEVLDNYYNISMDLITKYQLFNSKLKNYNVLQTINHLKCSNQKVFEDLKQIINDKVSKEYYLNKYKVLIDISLSNIEKYRGGTPVEEQNEVDSQNVSKNANDNSIETSQIEVNTIENSTNNEAKDITDSKKKKKKKK